LIVAADVEGEALASMNDVA